MGAAGMAMEAAAKRQKVVPAVEGQKWIVLGFHGFIGKAVVQCLRAAKFHVFGISHGQQDDLREALTRHEIAGIVNCAGLCRGPQSEVWDSQVGFVTAVAQICMEKGSDKAPRFVQISTERVYGWSKHPRLKAGEQDPSESWSSEVEKLLVDGCPHEKLSLIRPGNIYGPGAKANYNSAIATWIELALAGEDLIVHGDGHIRNFVHIGDVQKVVQQVCTSAAESLQVLDVKGISHSITVPANI